MGNTWVGADKISFPKKTVGRFLILQTLDLLYETYVTVVSIDTSFHVSFNR